MAEGEGFEPPAPFGAAAFKAAAISRTLPALQNGLFGGTRTRHPPVSETGAPPVAPRRESSPEAIGRTLLRLERRVPVDVVEPRLVQERRREPQRGRGQLARRRDMRKPDRLHLQP